MASPENEYPLARTIKDAIVRLHPPVGATPARIEEVVAECTLLGAVAVKVVPREREDRVLGLDVAAGVDCPRKTVREVLRDLVADPSVVAKGLHELGTVVEEALDVGERDTPPKLVPSQGASIWIERVVLRNWFRYRGEHVVDLKPTVYGVTATAEGDPERSNWQGKSSFLNIIAFGLHGWLPDYVRGADDWITRGESEGGVRIVLSDGSVVDRSRKKGKSTQLYVGIDGNVANQALAQERIDALLGLGREDFLATSFFPQREIARFVRAKPAERLEVVRGWLELDALGAAEEWARSKLADVIERERLLVGEVRTREDRIAGGRKAAGVPDEVSDRSDTSSWIEETVNAVQFGVEELRTRAREAERAAAGFEGWERDERVWREAQEVWASIKGLARERPSIEVVEWARTQITRLKAEESSAKVELVKSQDEARQKCQLAQGKFDGRCPVAGMQCPIADDINRDRKGNAALRDGAEKSLAKAGVRHRERRAELERAEQVIAEVDRADRQVGELEARLAGMRESIDRIGRDGHSPDRRSIPDPRTIWNDANTEEQRRRLLGETRVSLEKAWAELDELESERTGITREIATLREAARILGKGGAQKVIAVTELARVEALANGLLRENGIDLSVSIRWGRESSSQLSSSCESCGRTGITGTGKSCPTCKSLREPKVSEKLDVELSDRSGAAEDLGGLAIQVAASAWLRERRGARFGVVCIDEPFGALDASNARSLSAHLAGILRGKGCKQAFVIAHSSSAMDALPGRIRVTGLRDGSSKVEVLDG